MVITNEEFSSIVTYMRSNFGINLQQKRTLIEGRLSNYLIQNGYSTYKAYMDKVTKDKTGAEAKTLINILTTNHTYFWREPIHFQFMKNVALPQISAKEAATHSLRLWSAASSTGEEPYTIVMVLKDFFRAQAANWDTRILATDISEKVLAKAKEGIYLKEQLDPLPESWRRQFFEKCGEDQVQAKENLRREVIYRTLNLMDTFHFKSHFHIIFLRNVMIYFEEDTKRKLIDKMYEVLEPGGYLFLGSTEALDKNATRLTYVQPSVYQKSI